eukprot:scaffold48862_cov36-Phaeocystis_antarctica.AAC.1
MPFFWRITRIMRTSRRQSARIRVSKSKSHLTRAVSTSMLPGSNAGWIFVARKVRSLNVDSSQGESRCALIQ